MISFFFGAGASMYLGLPDMAGLKKELEQRCKDPLHKEIIKLYADQNLEELCRDVQEIIDLKNNDNNKILNKIQYNVGENCQTSYNELYEGLTKLQTILRDILLDKLEPNDNLETYEEMLNKIGIGARHCNIITTNYDLVLDRCLEYEMVDGFINDDYKENIKIWEDCWDHSEFSTKVVKLHGSINWQYNKHNYKRISDLNGSIYPNIEKPSVPGHRNIDRDVMLLPALNSKDYKKPPFNSLYDQFVEILGETDLLVSIGYSFKDRHINEEIKKYLKGGGNLLVVMPNPSRKTVDAFQDGKYTSNMPTQILVCDETVYSQSDTTNQNMFIYDSKFEPRTADNIGLVINTICMYLNGMPIEFKPLNNKERRQYGC